MISFSTRIFTKLKCQVSLVVKYMWDYYSTSFLHRMMIQAKLKFRTIIRIFHGCEVRIEKSARGSLFGITKLCQVMPNSDPEGQIFFYLYQTTMIDSSCIPFNL